jgi:hypothetical protein
MNTNATQRASLPDLETQHVIGVFDRDAQATMAEGALEEAGFRRDAISVIARQADAAPRISADGTKATEGVVKGAATGALLAGGLTAVSFAIPGLGPVLAAGRIAALVGGSVMGGSLGGLVGSFVGLGMLTEQAQEYEELVRSGAVVVDVIVPDAAHAEHATRILNDHGAQRVTSYEKHL